MDGPIFRRNPGGLWRFALEWRVVRQQVLRFAQIRVPPPLPLMSPIRGNRATTYSCSHPVCGFSGRVPDKATPFHVCLEAGRWLHLADPAVAASAGHGSYLG